MTCAGCATSVPPAPQVIKVYLPPAPADFGRPVDVRPPRIGEDARAFAAREKVGRLTANQRLENDRRFYDSVQKKFSN